MTLAGSPGTMKGKLTGELGCNSENMYVLSMQLPEGGQGITHVNANLSIRGDVRNFATQAAVAGGCNDTAEHVCQPSAVFVECKRIGRMLL